MADGLELSNVLPFKWHLMRIFFTPPKSSSSSPLIAHYHHHLLATTVTVFSTISSGTPSLLSKTEIIYEKIVLLDLKALLIFYIEISLSLLYSSLKSYISSGKSVDC